jgi:hypothetical protein
MLSFVPLPDGTASRKAQGTIQAACSVPIHPDIERDTQDYKPERQKLAGQPEVNRQIEKGQFIQ